MATKRELSPITDGTETERIARTEALYREVNERIAESADRFEADEAEFICECADPGCAQRVEATLAKYEGVRSDGATFLLARGHADLRVEAVVERANGHDVVEKRHPGVVSLVRRLDPRAA